MLSLNHWRVAGRYVRCVCLIICLGMSASHAAVSVSPWKMAGQNKYLYFCYAALESELPVSATEGAICAADDADAIFVYHDGAWVEVVAGVGGGDSFKTIDAPAGTDPAADSSTDTLLITASGGLTVTGDSAADTLAFVVGNVATATALAANPTACGAGDFVTDIAADGTLTCSTPGGGLTHPQIMTRLAVGGGY